MFHSYRVPFAEEEYKKVIESANARGISMAGYIRMSIIEAQKEYLVSNPKGLYMCMDKIVGERFYINVRLDDGLHDFLQQLSMKSSIAESQIIRHLMVNTIGGE